MPAVPWIVLPTFDEAENLEAIAAAILPIMREAVGRESFRVLVVDDNSPDGTGQIADRLAAEEPELQVLHRPVREGLGPAYLAGFAVALAGGLTAIYPRSSPGGWQLIGSTDLVLWDLDREEPALLRAGDRVRFVEVS